MGIDTIDRRTFLKIMGLGGSGLLLPLTGCSSSSGVGTEQVTSYLDPEEYAIPGDEVWYASTCSQCPAACGIHARVREGRARKLEGNPISPVNNGRLCAMGQAGVQLQYHPERLKRPLLKQHDGWREIDWEEARKRLAQAIARAAGSGGERFGLLSGACSGHLGALMDAFTDGLGGARRYVYEPLACATAEATYRQVLGTSRLRLNVDRAHLVVSFGADFLGPWQTPVHHAVQYGRFRDAPRGTLIQVEPKMTLTGANADWWLAVRPGTEGWLMLGVARLLAFDAAMAERLPVAVRESLQAYDLKGVSEITGVSAQDVQRLADALQRHSPSLVLAGGPAESQEQGGAAIAAALLLNHMLGNIGTTVVPAASLPFPQLEFRGGNSRALFDLADALPELDTLFVYGANPLYGAPDSLELQDKFAAVPIKVAFCGVPDETAMAADLIIPVRSSLEDWGTHVPPYAQEGEVLQLQQPVVEPLYPDVPGIGDLFLAFMRQIDPDAYGQWEDFYGYVRHSVALVRPLVQDVAAGEDEGLGPAQAERAFWETAVSRGVLSLPAEPAALQISLSPIVLVQPADHTDFPFTLVVSPRLGPYDGRHANLPWMQELPDPLTTVVWDSWLEIHPETAARHGIEEGDVVAVSSPHGELLVKAVLFPGIHPDAVAIPMGQGHRVGRYASGVGVNPLAILSPKRERETGELAWCATRVQLRHVGRKEPVVKLAPTDSQHGRRMVRTVPAQAPGQQSEV